MIGLPMTEDPPGFDLHPKIFLYNKILLVLNIVGLLILTIWLVIQNVGLTSLPFVFTLLIVIIIVLTILDIFNSIVIEKKNEKRIKFISQIYLLPVLLDIPLIFALGLGILRIFLRIVIFGALNPDTLYYDENDPLFT